MCSETDERACGRDGQASLILASKSLGTSLLGFQTEKCTTMEMPQVGLTVGSTKLPFFTCRGVLGVALDVFRSHVMSQSDTLPHCKSKKKKKKNNLKVLNGKVTEN